MYGWLYYFDDTSLYIPVLGCAFQTGLMNHGYFPHVTVRKLVGMNVLYVLYK